MTSPTKLRRTKKEVERLCLELYWIVEKNQPCTVRQVFYLAVSAGIIGKTEGDYKNTVCRLLAIMRENESMPFDWIADNTRFMRKPDSYDSLEEAVSHWQQNYRRAIWSEMGKNVQIWTEKDTLTSVFYPVTARYDIPLMTCRGYPSLSFLHGAGKEIEWIGDPAYIYYFGDFDPTGVDISRNVEEKLRKYSGETPLTFERCAVNEWQIKSFQLQTRPTKTTDSRGKNFGAVSVEVEAISPQMLRDICKALIDIHIDKAKMRELEVAEESEREMLKMFGKAA